MSGQRKNAVLGTLLVILGGLFLVETMGFIPQFTPTVLGCELRASYAYLKTDNLWSAWLPIR